MDKTNFDGYIESRGVTRKGIRRDIIKGELVEVLKLNRKKKGKIPIGHIGEVVVVFGDSMQDVKLYGTGGTIRTHRTHIRPLKGGIPVFRKDMIRYYGDGRWKDFYDLTEKKPNEAIRRMKLKDFEGNAIF